MPFYKWIIPTNDYSDKINRRKCTALWEESFHEDLIRILRELSQLLSTANDIFIGVETDCKTVQTRTQNLKLKIQRCQDVVDRLNPKTVKVPVSNLTNTCQPAADGLFESFQCLETRFFSADTRPDCILRLRKCAQGPSPPVYTQLLTLTPTDELPNCLSELNESDFDHIEDPFSNSSRDISSCSSQSSIAYRETFDDSSQENDASCDKQSTVVPIDVSGYTFQRMATLRRSLLQMDFLVRKKKKKDKRRNTISDIESSTLKNTVESADNSKQRLSVPCTPNEPDYLQDDFNIPMSTSEIIISDRNTVPNTIYSLSEENNNTKPFTDTNSKWTLKKTDSNIVSNEKLQTNYKNIPKDSFPSSKSRDNNVNFNKQPAEWAKRIKESVENKKKARTNIPISTLSAAMTVAVKMRQTSGLTQSDDNQSSSGNWSGSSSSGRASSDSDDIKAYLKDKVSSSRDSLLSECTPPHNARDSQTSAETEVYEEQQECSNLSQTVDDESLKPRCQSLNLVKSKSYSFDSDDDLSTTSYMGYNRYASSTSISTGSNESLNSLLSRTATELSGSTETLTSISKLPLPPPPPPPRISSVKPIRMVKFDKTVDIHSRTYPSNRKSRRKENQSTDKKLQEKIHGKSRDNKKGNSDDPKSTKVTLSSILHKKLKPKDNEKPKQQNSKIQKSPNNSGIDMYGGQLNNYKKITILVNGNMPSPEKPKVQMHSFLPKHVTQKDSGQMNNYSDINESPSIYSSSRASSRTECVSPASSEIFSDSAIESSEETNLPLKYAPQITVMPVKRTMYSYQTSTSPCLCNSCNNNLFYKSHQVPPVDKYSYFPSKEEQDYQQRLQYLAISPISQNVNNYNISRSANTAHVMLDTNGRVISSTNSLDRRLYNKHPHRVQSPSLVSDGVNYREPNFTEQKYFNGNSPLQSSPQRFNLQKVSYPEGQLKTMPISQNEIETKNVKSNVALNYNFTNSQNNNTDNQRNRSCYGSLPNRGKSRFENYGESTTYQSHNVFKDLDPSNLTQNEHNAYNISYSNSVSSNQSLLTKENVQQHLRNSDDSHKLITRSISNPLSDSFCNSKAQLSVNNSNIGNAQSETPVKSMTAEDLFAIIHNSKKRLNIKTESDLSPTPSSSRSSSPSFLRHTASSKNGLAETGFLSPRGSYPLSSRDRRSWADFRPASERKSLASDRMGPSKPTSLHEFKMLLLQTRSSGRCNQRQSAVEQLKATSPNRSMDIAENLSPTSLPPSLSPIQNSPTYGIYDGHLTVPLKRTHRSKGAVQPRYIMYPPIMEDCSEETENSSESYINNQPKCFIPKNKDCDVENWNSDNQIISNRDNNQTQPKVRFANSSMWV